MRVVNAGSIDLPMKAFSESMTYPVHLLNMNDCYWRLNSAGTKDSIGPGEDITYSEKKQTELTE